MEKRSLVKMMLAVAKLGLLKANPEELAKINDYMQQTYGSMGYLYEIKEHSIEIFYLDDNDNPVDVEDVTEEVLTDIYSE